GQNFSKAFKIRYLGTDDQEHYAWQTSWGISWRLIGAVVMVHGDDKGLVIPPNVAPIQVVIVPILYGKEDKEKILAKAAQIRDALASQSQRVHIDSRDEYTPGYKFHDWEMKGVPLRIEIGPKDLKQNKVVIARRDTGEKSGVGDDQIQTRVTEILQEIQRNLFSKAKELLEKNTYAVDDYDELKAKIGSRDGFAKTSWCGDAKCELKIKEETGADIRVIPFDSGKLSSGCVYCKREAKHTAYFARAF
ncbi:MAG: proline--tRNA ligase, partial [Nitrososphaerales archaeon]